MKKLMQASVAALALVAIGATGAMADDDDDEDRRKVTAYRYVAKTLCGGSPSNIGPLVEPGFYRTSVNALNPTANDIHIELVLYKSGTFPDTGGDTDSDIATLPAESATAQPCTPDTQPPRPFVEGFATVLTCQKGLVVEAVYTTTRIVAREVGRDIVGGGTQVRRIEPTKIKVRKDLCPVAD